MEVVTIKAKVVLVRPITFGNKLLGCNIMIRKLEALAVDMVLTALVILEMLNGNWKTLNILMTFFVLSRKGSVFRDYM